MSLILPPKPFQTAAPDRIPPWHASHVKAVGDWCEQAHAVIRNLYVKIEKLEKQFADSQSKAG